MYKCADVTGGYPIHPQTNKNYALGLSGNFKISITAKEIFEFCSIVHLSIRLITQ